MEAAVREAGALPATIGILDGKIVVGLKAEQIARLADADEVTKVSSSDLSAVFASGRLGATTVAGGGFVGAGTAGLSLAWGGVVRVPRGARARAIEFVRVHAGGAERV